MEHILARTDSTTLALKIAIGPHGHAAALKDGAVAPGGIRLEHVEVTPLIAAFRRMVRQTEFDVCEMSPTTYLTARAFNKPFTAIPVLLGRMFHTNALVFNERSGIQAAKDFEGKRVGVRAYTVATGVWVRGLLQDEYGLDLRRVTWVTDDEEHVTEFVAPANVIKAPPGRSLVEMLLNGELDAAFTGNAGVGRSGAPTAGWEAGAGSTPRVEDSPDIKPLLPDVGALEVERFRRTGVYPIHGVVVVKDAVLSAHPWVAVELFKAFKEAKRRYLAELKAPPSDSRLTRPTGEGAGSYTSALASRDQLMRRQQIVGEDPLPYGIEPNRSSLETMLQYAYDQKLTPQRYRIEEVFAQNTLELE